jgi:hypothetical protein
VADARRRNLERLAASGDAGALQALLRERLRAGDLDLSDWSKVSKDDRAACLAWVEARRIEDGTRFPAIDPSLEDPSLEANLAATHEAQTRGWLSEPAALESIEGLYLRNVEVQDPDAFVRAVPDRLLALELPSNLTRKHLRALGEKLSALRYLGFNRLPGAALAELEAFQELRGLDLRGAEGNRAISLPPLPQLRVLSTKIGKKNAVALEGAQANTPNLRELDMSRSSTNTIEFLSGWPKLEALSIADTEHIKTLEPVAALPRLERFSCAGLYRTADLTPLRACPQLRHVDLSGVKAKHVQALLACPELQAVYAREIKLSPAKSKGIFSLV